MSKWSSLSPASISSESRLMMDCNKQQKAPFLALILFLSSLYLRDRACSRRYDSQERSDVSTTISQAHITKTLVLIARECKKPTGGGLVMVAECKSSSICEYYG